MSSGIFISYRRLGGLDTARNLRDRLASYNYKVFFDLTSMREGKFNQQIFKEIEQADDFILILSEGALDRCVEEQDWLRLEIGKALALGKNIIPVWKPAFKGFPASLPKEIADIVNYDSVKFSDDYYDAFFQKLLARLKSQRIREEFVGQQYRLVDGEDSRFITLDEWLSKHFRFNFIRIVRTFFSVAVLLTAIVFFVAFTLEEEPYKMAICICCLLLTPFLIYSTCFMRRMKKRFSPDISEVERNRGTEKVVRNSAGDRGLIKVGFKKIELLIPCRYRSITKMDRNNYILATSEGNSLYNKKRRAVIGEGPFVSIKKSKYKIECMGKDGLQIFSLDGFRRFD